MSIQVTLIDAGTGNLRSVYKALQSLGADVRMTSDPFEARAGSRVVLPGVGAFGDFMIGLVDSHLDEAVLEIQQRGTPLLGICVGMQALFEGSEEMGTHNGLNLLPGRVLHFPSHPVLKIPHTGWNQLIPQADSPLWQKISTGDYAYFNHTYYCSPLVAGDVLAETEYITRFASAVQRDNIYGVQFHPEKSQRVGLQILENFLSI